MDALWRDSAAEHSARRLRWRLQHQIAAVQRDADTGVYGRPQGFDRAHSLARHPLASSFRSGLRREICVRTVRSGLTVGFQWVSADGRAVAVAATVRIVGNRPQGSEPRSHWPG